MPTPYTTSHSAEGQSQNPAKAFRLSPWAIAGFTIYAAAYFAFLYHPGLVRFDDFGYLQSVVETLARSRPYTHDWLGPYSAVTSTLSALAYLLTGDFPLSTWGLQAVIVLATFILLQTLLRIRLPPLPSACVALAIASQPVYWYKCAEFSGNALTFTLVLAALIAYSRRQWLLFFVAVFLAFANRQNSIALLSLPAFHLLFGDGDGSSRLAQARARWLMAAGIAACLAGGLALHFQMNRTASQIHSIYGKFDWNRTAGILQTVPVGVFTVLACLSFFGLMMGSDSMRTLKENFRRPALPSVATGLFLLVPILGSFPLVDFKAPFIGSLDREYGLQFALIAAVPILLWMLDWSIVRFSAPLCLCAGFILISSLRGFWYDIYLIEVGLAALYHVLASKRVLTPGRLSISICIVVFTIHVGWSYAFKILSDKNVLAIGVYEKLERAGQVVPDIMTDAPFGFLGWKLYDHYVASEPFTNLSGFLGYVEKERVVLDTELPWRQEFKRSVPAGAEILDTGWARVGFFPVRYRAMDLHGSQGTLGFVPALRMHSENYRRKAYPLSKQEWAAYIEARRTLPR